MSRPLKNLNDISVKKSDNLSIRPFVMLEKVAVDLNYVSS